MSGKIWYALYTRSRWEKRCAELIKANGYQVYLPLIKTLRQWSDRKKKVEIPLISGYVFVNISESEYYKILETPGIVCYVTFEGKAAPIRSSQIEAIKMAIDGGLKMEHTNKYLSPGQKVKIISGPMKNMEGEYEETVNKSNFIINLNNIGFSLKVEINALDVINI